MTPESYLKHKAVIEAWANGAEVEFRAPSQNVHVWTPAPTPRWLEHIDYRVKPKALDYYIIHLKPDAVVTFHIPQVIFLSEAAALAYAKAWRFYDQIEAIVHVTEQSRTEIK